MPKKTRQSQLWKLPISLWCLPESMNGISRKTGKIYHHILDPATGYPCETDLYGVTILSKKSVDGDGYSTICLSLGLKEGLKFINQQDGIEAIFITSDYKLHYSDGLKDLN